MDNLTLTRRNILRLEAQNGGQKDLNLRREYNSLVLSGGMKRKKQTTSPPRKVKKSRSFKSTLLPRDRQRKSYDKLPHEGPLEWSLDVHGRIMDLSDDHYYQDLERYPHLRMRRSIWGDKDPKHEYRDILDAQREKIAGSYVFRELKRIYYNSSSIRSRSADKKYYKGLIRALKFMGDLELDITEHFPIATLRPDIAEKPVLKVGDVCYLIKNIEQADNEIQRSHRGLKGDTILGKRAYFSKKLTPRVQITHVYHVDIDKPYYGGTSYRVQEIDEDGNKIKSFEEVVEDYKLHDRMRWGVNILSGCRSDGDYCIKRIHLILAKDDVKRNIYNNTIFTVTKNAL